MKQDPKSFKEYIQGVVDQVGSDVAVARYLGFGDGSRIGLWRKGEGRPDELNCIKIARWMGDDPLAILRVAGYHEMADLLKGTAGPPPVQFSILRPHLASLQGVLSGMLEAMEGIEKGGRK
jgi:hypothetical protein